MVHKQRSTYHVHVMEMVVSMHYVGGCSYKKFAELLGNRPCQQTVQTVLNGHTRGVFSRQGRKGSTHGVRKLDMSTGVPSHYSTVRWLISH
jgi:hypothetical protein